jgi:hypothetical protein
MAQPKKANSNQKVAQVQGVSEEGVEPILNEPFCIQPPSLFSVADLREPNGQDPKELAKKSKPKPCHDPQESLRSSIDLLRAKYKQEHA